MLFFTICISTSLHQLHSEPNSHFRYSHHCSTFLQNPTTSHSLTPIKPKRSIRNPQSIGLKRIVAQINNKNDTSAVLPVPSAVLLLTSSVLAIAAIGCVFELSSGHPQYGTKLTSAILLVAGPAFPYLFWQAIRKGRAESEE